MRKNTKPEVSVCIPTYNGGQYLRECLDSVITQTYHNIEILIMDDGSSDDTLEICNHYAAEDERIKIIKNDKNLGLVQNWNKCIEYASNDWIKFVFQDDILHSYCIERMIHLCVTENCPIGVCNRLFIFEADADPSIRSYFEKKLKKLSDFENDSICISAEQAQEYVSSTLLENIFGEPTTYLFNREMVDLKSFDKKIDQLCDYEFVAINAMDKGLCYNSEPLAFFRIHTNAQSTVNRGENRNVKKTIKVDYVDNLYILDKFKKWFGDRNASLLKEIEALEGKISDLIQKNVYEDIYQEVKQEVHNA